MCLCASTYYFKRVGCYGRGTRNRGKTYIRNRGRTEQQRTGRDIGFARMRILRKQIEAEKDDPERWNAMDCKKAYVEGKAVYGLLWTPKYKIHLKPCDFIFGQDGRTLRT